MELERELKTTFKGDRQKLILNIMFTANWLQQFQNKIFRQKKLTLQQFNILRILKGSDQPLTIKAIKERMLERESDVSRIVEKLRKQNLIDRCTDHHDRRAVRCTITDTGNDLLNQLDASVKQFEVLTQGISLEEVKSLNLLLDRLRTNLPLQIQH